MAQLVLVRRTSSKKHPPRPIGAKLQTIAHLDPAWVHDLERLIDWKMTQLGVKKAS